MDGETNPTSFSSKKYRMELQLARALAALTTGIDVLTAPDVCPLNPTNFLKNFGQQPVTGSEALCAEYFLV